MLTGRLCVLRPFTSSDAKSIAEHANNGNVARQLRDRFPHPYKPADARRFLAAVARMRGEQFAIAIDGVAVGGIGYSPGSDVERYSAEVGYWLGERFWGRGVTTEALTLMTAHMFERAGLLRAFALPFADNDASARVLEKAGYTLEGRLRSSSVKLGRARDQLIYARINPEWTLRE